MQEERTSIRRCFENASVLVTGGTGFVGKMLIDKLLRTCAGLRAVYVVVREKEGRTAKERLDELFDDEVFAPLKKQSPGFVDKLVAVPGDIGQPDSGISSERRRMLEENIDVVFHCAATVRFDVELKEALRVNVYGTQQILEISKRIKRLKAFVHISTAYAHCYLDRIDEVFYSVPHDPLQLLASLDCKDCSEETFLGKWPNSYTFTKALAEKLIESYEGVLPLAVVRPSITQSTYREPVEGWTDSANGPTGVCAAAMAGVLRVFNYRRNALVDIIPVDMCVNAAIAVAWNLQRTHFRSEKIKIYNVVSSNEKPLTWEEYSQINLIYGKRFPFSRALWYINFTPVENALLQKLMLLVTHLLPAFLVDVLRFIVGKKPKKYNKLIKLMNLTSYFTNKTWEFRNENTRKLYSDLEPDDRSLFDFDASRIDWLRYWKSHILGIRHYLLKDNISTVPLAIERQRRFFYLNEALKMFCAYLTICSFWNFVSKLYKRFRLI